MDDLRDSNESKVAKTISEEYKLPVENDYKSQTIRVPGDFSTAALLMSAAIMSEGVIGDKEFGLYNATGRYGNNQYYQRNGRQN